MPLLARPSSGMIWWPVTTLKRGYNGTNSANRAGYQQGGVSVKVTAQEDDGVAFSYSSPTTTDGFHVSVSAPAPTPSTSTSSLPSLHATITPTKEPDAISSHSLPRTTTPSGLGILAEAAAAVTTPETLPSSATAQLSAVPLLSTTLEPTHATPTDNPMNLPSTDRGNGLSPDEITIIVAVVISFSVFLLLLATAIRCAILQRRKHEARERARRIQARNPMSRLPPALKKPPESSLHGASTARGGGHLTEDEPNLEDDNTEFRIVIRPPPGYQTPQSGATTPIDSHHYPPGSRPPSARAFGMPAAGCATPNEGGHHWSLDTENGSVLSGSTRKINLNRLSITTTESG
ncbi:hypothetical protein PG997_010309 [Apiospora hydei]|uniref:Uncharacterized protein n=1 Tax=Apiospora hydei TaxID=1337664 RepID=A0ABR1VWL2_9PEZI